MSINSQILLEVENLSGRYENRLAVDNVSFQLHKGDILGLLGLNGAGKSTTMQMICGVLAPSAGRVRINSIDLLENPKEAKACIGYLPEHAPIYSDLTVDEYLRYCAQLHRVARKHQAAVIARTKARCGLDHCGKRLLGQLSKGYQQRAGIAQAILHTPLLVVLDEPTAGLDPIQIHAIRNLIVEIGQEHAVILSTHLLPEVQLICNRVQIMHHGRLIFNDNTPNRTRRHTTLSLRVDFHHPPEHSRLTTIEGIKTAMLLDSGHIRIYTEDTHGTIDRLIRTSLEQNWGLIELTPERESLEQLFVELTSGDSFAYPAPMENSHDQHHRNA